MLQTLKVSDLGKIRIEFRYRQRRVQYENNENSKKILFLKWNRASENLDNSRNFSRE